VYEVHWREAVGEGRFTVLGKIDGEREHLSLKNAEEIMSGYLAD